MTTIPELGQAHEMWDGVKTSLITRKFLNENKYIILHSKKDTSLMNACSYWKQAQSDITVLSLQIYSKEFIH